MSQRTLYLRLGDSDGPVEWLLVTADGTRRIGCDTLAELPVEAHASRLVVLVPATAVTLASATLPPVKRAQQRQAALFALEDQLIDDIGDLHAALGERASDGTLPVAVVSRARLDGWLAALTQHHLRPEQVTVDLFLLPLAEGEWSVLWEDHGVLVRSGSGRGIGLDPGQWPVLWPRLLAEAGGQAPRRLRVFDARSDQTEPLPLDEALPGGEVSVVANAASLQWLATSSSVPLNLLQGDYSRREQWGRMLRPWRPAAALLLIWLAIEGGLAYSELSTLRAQEAQLEVQMEELYRKSFPEARKVVDPRLQMEQKLNALKSGSSGFLKLAVAVAPALRSSQVTGMRYQEGALDVDLSLPDMGALDSVRAALIAKGLQVEIGNAAQQGGKVTSRVTVRGGGA